MITVETYADLPRKIGAHAFVILGLLQAAKMAGAVPTTAQWLFDHAPNYGTGSITAALRKLTSSEIQLAARVTGGWVLNDQGAFQLPLGYSLVDGQNRISENRSQSDFVDGKVVEVKNENRSQSDSRLENVEISGKNRSESDSQTGSIKILIDDDESYLKTDSSSSILNPERKFPTLEMVLSNLDIVFDDELHVGDVPANTSPELALAWVSKLYKDKYIDRRKLDNPIGTLITRLRSGARRKMHLEFLPDAYLTAVGLWQKRCVFCDADFTSKSSFDAHMLDGHEQDEPDPDAIQVFEPTQPGDELAEPRRVWGMVLDQLRPEVGRAAFESWLQNTVVVGFEQEVLQVGTNRKYAQDWLTRRATDLAEKLVSEIMGISVSVKFVLADV